MFEGIDTAARRIWAVRPNRSSTSPIACCHTLRSRNDPVCVMTRDPCTTHAPAFRLEFGQMQQRDDGIAPRLRKGGGNFCHQALGYRLVPTGYRLVPTGYHLPATTYRLASHRTPPTTPPP